jgi:hypothetical protein
MTAVHGVSAKPVLRVRLLQLPASALRWVMMSHMILRVCFECYCNSGLAMYAGSERCVMRKCASTVFVWPYQASDMPLRPLMRHQWLAYCLGMFVEHAYLSIAVAVALRC